LISSILLFLLVGPFLIFSEFGGLTQSNPVLRADLSLSFVVNKTVYANSTTGQLIPGISAQQAIDIQASIDEAIANGTSSTALAESITTSIPYKFYENHNGFLRTYDTDLFTHSNFSHWTETRYFQPDMIQECMYSEFADTLWDISSDNKLQMSTDMMKSLNKPQPNHLANFSLEIDMDFKRALPAEAMTASHKISKVLNYSIEYDCKTGLQL
jgi:hypothetical protein